MGLYSRKTFFIYESFNFSGHPERNQQMMMLDDVYARPPSVINIVEIPDASETNPRPDNDGEKSLGEFISIQMLVCYI